MDSTPTGTLDPDAASNETDVLPPPPADFRLLEVALGNTVDGEGRVIKAGDRFLATDTLHLSVLASATSAPLTLSARWSRAGGAVVAEDRQALPAGPASLTHFHIAHPRGWPTGSYRVELTLNGLAIDHRDFVVAPP